MGKQPLYDSCSFYLFIIFIFCLFKNQRFSSRKLTNIYITFHIKHTSLTCSPEDSWALKDQVVFWLHFNGSWVGDLPNRLCPAGSIAVWVPARHEIQKLLIPWNISIWFVEFWELLPPHLSAERDIRAHFYSEKIVTDHCAWKHHILDWAWVSSSLCRTLHMSNSAFPLTHTQICINNRKDVKVWEIRELDPLN